MEHTHTEFTQALRKQLLDAVSQTVQSKLFDPKFNGCDWPALVRSRTEEILRRDDPAAFQSSMRALLEDLGVRPVDFFHESNARVPIHHVLRATLFPDGDRWMFQDVSFDGAAHASGIEPGDILLAIKGEPVAPPATVKLPPAKPVTLDVQKRNGESVTILPSAPSPEVARSQLVRVSMLQDGVGHLKVSRFPGLVGVDMARDIDSAVRQLSEYRTAVIDLRGNPGGGSANLRLMSYLISRKVPVGYSLTRPRAERGYQREELPRFTRIPKSKLALVWLALRFKFVDKSIVVVTEGLPAPRFQGRAVLLVNEHTVSGSEIVAGFVKEHRLATIVGSRTAGRLYGWSSLPVGNGYRLTIPVSNYLSWDGKCFEGTGIEPDVEVPFSPAAALNGRDYQLDEAAKIAARL